MFLGHDRFDNLLRDIIEGKMLGKATRGRKRMEFLHMMEGRNYGQLKDLISDRSKWRQVANDNACQKPADKSRRLKKKKFNTHLSAAVSIGMTEHNAGTQADHV